MDYRVNVQEGTLTTRWYESLNDDSPVESWKTVWALELEIETSFPWGPLKTRANAKVEHSGNSVIRVRECRDFRDQQEAERYSLELCSRLNSKGYQGTLTADKSGIFEKSLFDPIERVRLISSDIPNALRKRVLQSAQEQIRDIFRG